MDFIIGIMVFILLGLVVLKLLALFLHVGVAMLALPFKLLGLVLALILTPLILVPLGLFAGLVALPFALFGPTIPIILIALGIWAILKRP
ncbi:MAG TPA: hypothetical protein ENL21_04170 [Caldithrix abyssi]|uniref:Uncharacterized protein n=1 Tax=Caldithrix abyssi TaxID=187145 RepID=A0A7V5LIE7_CALAY|nr:hypothetical protein [Caldisericaceae bacterium]HHE54953.1 hypothetical protein [Caldithrix abyssi]